MVERDEEERDSNYGQMDVDSWGHDDTDDVGNDNDDHVGEHNEAKTKESKINEQTQITWLRPWWKFALSQITPFQHSYSQNVYSIL